jgi:hypothetical protein
VGAGVVGARRVVVVVGLEKKKNEVLATKWNF